MDCVLTAMRSIRRALRALRHHISNPAVEDLVVFSRDYPVSSTFGQSRSRSR
jgi:hypothetical protein